MKQFDFGSIKSRFNSCFTYIFYEAILPVICFVLISVVFAGGVFSMHILCYQVRLRSEVIHVHKDLYIDKLVIRRTTAMLGIGSSNNADLSNQFRQH